MHAHHEVQQRTRLAELRAQRDAGELERSLQALRDAAASGENVIPHLLDAVRAHATLYEVRHAMEEVFGAYREPVFF